MAYLRGERQQTQLFPASLEEYVGVEDPVRVYDAFVNQLDFKLSKYFINNIIININKNPIIFKIGINHQVGFTGFSLSIL